MRNFFIILGLTMFLVFPTQSYAQVVPEKIDQKTAENYELVNKLAEDAFKNIPTVTESVKKMTIDPQLYIVEGFYKNIESGKLEYKKEYDFAINEKITLSEAKYFREMPRETFRYSKEGKLLSYSTYTSREFPYVEYCFLPESWKLDSVDIKPIKEKIYSFNSNGKFLPDPDFGPYMKNLEKKIKSNWHADKHSIIIKTVVLFKLDKKGNLSKLKIERSTGSTEEENNVLNAVKNSTPFEPLPADYKGEDIDVQMTFDYNVSTIAEILINKIKQLLR